MSEEAKGLTIEDVKFVMKGVIDRLTDPPPGEALATHYVVKRDREYCMVRRDCLTVSERARHVRGLRFGKVKKRRNPDHADALEEETFNLIWEGKLRLTAEEAEEAEGPLRSGKAW